MSELLTETVEPNDLKKFEQIYHAQLYKHDVTHKAQFDYAWCLVRSKYTADMKKGISLLEDLYKIDEEGRRDYLFYLAVGHARLKEYNTALKFLETFLRIEPGNQQVVNLQTAIKKKMEKEGLVGMAMAGGAVLAVGAIVGIGMAIANKAK